MSNLPDHRRAIYGRTHDRIWYPGDYDPITVEHAVGRVTRAILSFAAALGGAALLFHLVWRLL
jgi:hypothetical protein